MAKISAVQLNVGDSIRAPWREGGDDHNLTGVVIERDRRKQTVLIRWNADGDVTDEGDMSVLRFSDAVERV